MRWISHCTKQKLAVANCLRIAKPAVRIEVPPRSVTRGASPALMNVQGVKSPLLK